MDGTKPRRGKRSDLTYFFRNTQWDLQEMLDIGDQQWVESQCGQYEQERNVSSC